MIKQIIPVITLILLITTTGIKAQDPPNHIRIYSKDKSYSVAIPKTMNLKHQHNEKNMAIWFYHYTTDFLLIKVETRKNISSLQQLSDEYVKKLIKTDADYHCKLMNVSTDFIANSQAERITFTSTVKKKNRSYINIFYIIYRNDKVYTYSISMAPTNLKQHEPIFKSIINSTRFAE